MHKSFKGMNGFRAQLAQPRLKNPPERQQSHTNIKINHNGILIPHTNTQQIDQLEFTDLIFIFS